MKEYLKIAGVSAGLTLILIIVFAAVATFGCGLLGISPFAG